MSFRDPKGYTFGAVLGPERVPKKTPEWILLGGGKAGKRFVFLMFSRSADVSKATPNGIKTVPKMEPKRGPKWSHKQAQTGGRNWASQGTETPFRINENK